MIRPPLHLKRLYMMRKTLENKKDKKQTLVRNKVNGEWYLVSAVNKIVEANDFEIPVCETAVYPSDEEATYSIDEEIDCGGFDDYEDMIDKWENGDPTIYKPMGSSPLWLRTGMMVELVERASDEAFGAFTKKIWMRSW